MVHDAPALVWTTVYGLTHRNLGTVSLLGPMRMDYVLAIEAVRSASHELSRFVTEFYEN